VRLRDIGIISNSTLTYTFQSVARSWRTREPEPMEPPPPNPSKGGRDGLPYPLNPPKGGLQSSPLKGGSEGGGRFRGVGKREQPQRFERLCYRALAEGLISLAKAAELLQQPITEVERELKGPGLVNGDNHQ
jgi:hypothetical protein